MNDRLEEIKGRIGVTEDEAWLIATLESARIEIARIARLLGLSKQYCALAEAGRDRWKAQAEKAKIIIQDLMTWAPNCTARDRAKTWLEDAALEDKP